MPVQGGWSFSQQLTWEETRIPGENPLRRGENMRTPQSGPSQESIFSHQLYNKMVWFEDLLHKALYI